MSEIQGWADVNEKKFHGLRLFKRKKKDANDKRCKMKKGGVITFFPKKVESLTDVGS